MMGRSRVLPFVVAAAVATIIITNFSILNLLVFDKQGNLHLFYAVWPLLLPTTVAIILVMSALYQALQGVLNELEKREELARSAGFSDSLTGLGSRHLLADHLQRSSGNLRRHGRHFAVLMLDLDRFKNVNDLHGHPIGDKLLKQVAVRLREVIRETDTLIRFGGDEFVVLQNDIAEAADVERLSIRIGEVLRKPFLIDAHELRVGASVGAVLVDSASDDTAEYLRKADIALYEAKRRGRDRIEFYSTNLDARLQRRTDIEKELADAISKGAVDVYYQPQVAANGTVIAAEALLRWNSRQFGAVSPAEIVGIAENCGLIRPLGKLVLKEACKAAKSWPGLTVAVNFSPSQLFSPDLPQKLARICHEEGIPCDRIELELTESLFLEYGEGCEDLIAVLRKHGFKIALDDFGAGYSSLRYLRRFKVDKVKLDKGFSDGSEARQNIAIIRAAVMLAHALGLIVVAEGIESEEQEQMAIQGGCDGFQGFRYAPAMTAQQLSEYLNHRSATAA